MSLEATHSIDGVLVAQKADASGRVYFVDVATHQRVKSAGKEAVPVAPALSVADIARQLDRPDTSVPPAPAAEQIDPFAQTEASDAAFIAAISVEMDGAAEPDADMQPVELSFAEFAVAVAGYESPIGYHERGGLSAKKVGPMEVELSVPHPQSRFETIRYRVYFPETLFFAAVRIA